MWIGGWRSGDGVEDVDAPHNFSLLAQDLRHDVAHPMEVHTHDVEMQCEEDGAEALPNAEEGHETLEEEEEQTDDDHPPLGKGTEVHCIMEEDEEDEEAI